MAKEYRSSEDLLSLYLAGRINRRAFLRGIGALGGGTLIGSILAACGQQSPAPEQASATATSAPATAAATAASTATATGPVTGGRLILAQGDPANQLDPTFANLGGEMMIYKNIFSKLLYLDQDLNIVPGLATSYRQVDDLTWEFELVDNAYFHNDEHFTAEDVRYTFTRLLDEELASPWSTYYTAIESIDVLDDYRVQFNLRNPYAPFLTNLATVGSEIVNEKAMTDLDPKLQPIGTGPFRLASWEPGDHLILEKWDKYYRTGKPYLDEVTIRFMLEDASRLVALQTGEVDATNDVPHNRVEDIVAEGNLKLVESPPLRPYFVYLNTKTHEALAIKEVRQAIAIAFPREPIVQTVFFNRAVVNHEPLPPWNPYHTGLQVWGSGHDLEEARQLLSDAGYGDGFEVSFTGFSEVHLGIAQVVKEALRPLNVTVNIEAQESAVWVQGLVGKTFQMSTSFWEFYIDPDNVLYPFQRSGQFWNLPQVENEELDALLEQGRTTLDENERKEIYEQAVTLIQEEAGLLTVASEILTFGMKPEVQDLQYQPTMEYRLEDVWWSS